MGFKEAGLRGSLRNVSVGASVIPDSVIDHFEESLYEDQNLTLSDRYGGDNLQFSRQQTTVYEGSYALEASSSQTLYFIADTDNETLQQGDAFGAFLRNSMTYVFAAQSESGAGSLSGYYGELDAAQGGWKAFRLDSGSTTPLFDRSLSLSSSKWYDHRLVDWQTDGTMEFELVDPSNSSVLDSVSVTDDTYSSGGYGWGTYDGGFGDNYRLL